MRYKQEKAIKDINKASYRRYRLNIQGINSRQIIADIDKVRYKKYK